MGGHFPRIIQPTSPSPVLKCCERPRSAWKSKCIFSLHYLLENDISSVRKWVGNIKGGGNLLGSFEGAERKQG